MLQNRGLKGGARMGQRGLGTDGGRHGCGMLALTVAVGRDRVVPCISI